MLRFASSLACFGMLLTACSGTPERKTTTVAAGDKASVEKLTYSVVDTEIMTHLGDEANPRTPRNRFYVVQLSVSNAGGSEAAIPGMALIADSGTIYNELTDGTGVPRWMGVTRRVDSNQTELGSIVFDAPAGHYKLRLTDDTDANDVLVDLPLSFAHEQMQNEAQTTSESVTVPGDGTASTSAVPAKKK